MKTNSMKSPVLHLAAFFLAFAMSGKAAVYYMAPDGNDTNPGTIDMPLASVKKAQELVAAGDTVYIRGGTYTLDNDDISRVYNNLFACYAFIDKSGTSGKRINYWAYPGEQPVFDFNAVQPADQRVVGFYVTASYVHFRGLEITGVQVTITTHTESYCFYSYGNYNIYEQLKLHDNQGTGLRHRKGGHNLFLNCDAYRNHDYTSEDGRGGNTDGFGCHPDDGGTGNVFRGCRAWFNSDDGFDFIGSYEPVKIENCWAMYNGYSPNFTRLADGNGFKAGGEATVAPENLPDPVPRHIIQFCLAVRNKASGFYANHHPGGITWYNNSSYRNSSNYNMLNRLLDNVTDVPGYDHIMRNNLGYKGGSELINIDKDQCDLEHNYFDLDVIVSDEDFLSLDESVLTGPRQEDGSLPDTKFMKLARGSDLVDVGTECGFEYYGSSPDLGAYEQMYFPFPDENVAWYQNYTPAYYWLPGNEPRYMIFGMPGQDSLINGQYYHRLVRYQNEGLDPVTAVTAGYIREDPLRRVYYRGEGFYPDQPADTGDILLFDFRVTVGDTVRDALFLKGGEQIVSKVDSVLAGDFYRPRIHFKNDTYTKWIEGIGSERGLLFYANEFFSHGPWSELVCFWHYNRELIHNPDFENCYEEVIDDVPPVMTEDDFIIYPNPVTDILTIRSTAAGSGFIELHSVNGQLIFKTILKGQEFLLDMSGYPSGLYFLKISSGEHTSTKKLIKP